MMEEPGCNDAIEEQPWSTAFAITGFQVPRKVRPQYRPSNSAKIGTLDPIYEDITNAYSARNNIAKKHSNASTGSNCSCSNGRANQAYRHDYDEIDELECGQNLSRKKRSKSMFTDRKPSAATQMMNELMAGRMKARRKTVPSNQAIQTADWKPSDFTAQTSDGTAPKRAKSSIYHKGNLYVQNSLSRKDDDKRRWTKLEAEPPQDGYLCCPAEKKLEKRGFVVLFVIIVLLVLFVLAFMIDRWVIIKVGDGDTELTWKNGTVTSQ